MDISVNEYNRNNYAAIPETGCWLWLGKWTTAGYGQARMTHGTQVSSHRLFYVMHKGPIPDGMVVMHKCDTPPCCNPEHLTLGTHAENMSDMQEKGRLRRGSNKSKITPEVAGLILSNAATWKELWTRYGVSGDAIKRFRRRHNLNQKALAK